MTTATGTTGRSAPPRLRRPGVPTLVIVLVVGALLVHGWTQGAAVRPDSLATGVFRLGEFVQDAVPPDTGRLGPILAALLVTVQMALLGTLLGVLASLPLAVLAARNTPPHWSLYTVSRLIVTVSRTIPDLVWGLIFVIAVGLGPEAGVLGIAVDVMGFCGRFFAERIEDLEPGRLEALRALGEDRCCPRRRSAATPPAASPRSIRIPVRHRTIQRRTTCRPAACCWCRPLSTCTWTTSCSGAGPAPGSPWTTRR